MKGEKIVSEEDLLLTFAEEYEALVENIRFSEGFCLLFVECSPVQGTKIMEKVRLDIPEEKAEVLPLDKTIYNFYNRVKEFSNLKKIDILFVTGLEYSLYQYEDEMKERGWDDNEIISISNRGVPPVLVNLNQQRERFRDDFDICFVFLLPKFAVDYLIKRAPDFFDWRSGLFRFPMDKENLEHETLQAYFKRLKKEDYENLTPQEYKKELIEIQSLIDEDHQTLERKVDLLIEEGRLNSNIGKYLEAISAYDKALEFKPENDQAWYNKGIALKNLGRHEQAISAYDKALEIKPDDDQAWFHKGVAFLQLKFYQQAIVAYKKSLDIKPDNEGSISNLGLIKYEIGKIDEAIEHWQAALKINNQFVEPKLAIGVALYNKGEISEGLTIAKAALKLDKSWGNLQRLKKELWGKKLLSDTAKLLENPQIKALLLLHI
ncbi:tetratricopeptide repeat protein [Okeania sp.]|uniref:tetratricopeptide repeat protein n=1 Tax=Okeania sp. TaxID=3100323 RepID=UPI002B4B1503|nr:tetratricopeptide repeat protein [Okeania sp.]MEB3340484.1 tetratricopeptide repeat protein [Okeania sp.]